MAQPQRPLLDRLVAPTTVARFLSEHWPDKAFTTHGEISRLPDYLRGDALSGFRALASRYRGTVAFGNATTGSGVATAANLPVALMREMGLSLYLPDLEQNVPGTTEFLRGIEQELGAVSGCARIGAFAAAVHNGVTWHYDAEEVISVQLEGSKRFHIAPVREIAWPWGAQYGPGYEAFPDLYPQLQGPAPQVDEATVETVEMRPGSVLFMPRGTWHRTEASSESLSVSIILRQPAPFETVLERLRLALLHEPQWRRPLYSTVGPEEAKTRVAALLGDLPAAVASLDAKQVLDATLSDAARLSGLDPETWLHRVPNARLELSPHPQNRDAHAAVVFLHTHAGGDQEIVRLDVPAAMLPPFEWLARHQGPLRADMLEARFPDIPFARHRTILDVLVRAGFLKLLSYAPRKIDGSGST